jgi:hypothetical protein
MGCDLPQERKKVMAEKKITKREKFEMLLPLVEGNEMLTEFVNHEIELLANKASKGSSKANEEQEAFFEVIRDILAECVDAKGMQCSAIAKDGRALGFEWKDKKETSPQRVSAMLTKLVAKGDVVKSTDKKVTYFRLA